MHEVQTAAGPLCVAHDAHRPSSRGQVAWVPGTAGTTVVLNFYLTNSCAPPLLAIQIAKLL